MKATFSGRRFRRRPCLSSPLFLSGLIPSSHLFQVRQHVVTQSSIRQKRHIWRRYLFWKRTRKWRKDDHRQPCCQRSSSIVPFPSLLSIFFSILLLLLLLLCKFTDALTSSVSNLFAVLHTRFSTVHCVLNLHWPVGYLPMKIT